MTNIIATRNFINTHNLISQKIAMSDKAEVTSPENISIRKTEKSGSEVSSSMVSMLLGQGKLAETQKSVAPDILAPAVAPDSGLLRQQLQEFGGRLQQSMQLKQERANEVPGHTDRHASPVGSIDFSAPNIQRQDSSSATGKQSAHHEQQSMEEERHSQAGSGLLDGASSAKAQLMVQLIQSQTRMRNADKTCAVESNKLSQKSTQLAAKDVVDSGKARRNELITSAATNFSMVAMGTAQSHRGINTQKAALNNHKAPAMAHQNRAMDLHYAGQVKTGHQLTGPHAGDSNGVRFAGDTPDRIQNDRAALERPAQNHQRRQAEHQFEYDHMQLTGQRQQQQGQALTMSAGAAGGLAGAQFGMDASQAQSKQLVAEGNTRIYDATSSQKDKQADTANAIIAALLTVLQQLATANAETLSTIASNTAR